MKKILWTMVLFLIFISPAVAEEPEKQQQEDQFYWMATADTLTPIWGTKEAVKLTQPQATPAPIFPFTEKLKNQLESLILTFDSFAISASNKTKQLAVDEIEISVTLTAEGHLAIASAKTEGSIKIKLRPKK